MENKEWTFPEYKEKMPDGEWQQEPDKKQWTDEKTKLPCLIVRNPLGALCGYVGVPPTHPYYQRDYNNCDVSAHGGLTFAGKCHPQEGDRGICHIAPPEEDEVWWLGFDCAHLGDYVPGMGKFFNEQGTYKHIAYVEDECRELAEQLIAIK